MHGDRVLTHGFERRGNQDDPDESVQKQEWSIQAL